MLDFMAWEILRLPWGDRAIPITLWQLYGWTGALLFAGRWFVQLHASRKAGKPVMTRAFWLMSLCGSVILLTYFAINLKDSVGVLQNLFPIGIAGYNLYLDVKSRRAVAAAPGAADASAPAQDGDPAAVVHQVSADS